MLLQKERDRAAIFEQDSTTERDKASSNKNSITGNTTVAYSSSSKEQESSDTTSGSMSDGSSTTNTNTNTNQSLFPQLQGSPFIKALKKRYIDL